MKKKAGTIVEKKLIVIGAGPVGVAALFYAGVNKIDALALEAGALPLHQLHQYINGLVLASPGAHYEVAGIPLDCKDEMQVTKEEVLHYYSRLINFGKLDIRTGRTCIALEPKGKYVKVVALHEGREEIYHAEKVIFTSWFEKRKFSPVVNETKSAILVRNGMTNPFEFAGKKITILGGGMSGYEIASSLMMNGQSINLLLRGDVKSYHNQKPFARLLRLTNSNVFNHVSEISFGEQDVFFKAGGELLKQSCEVFIYSIGWEIPAHRLKLLEECGALSNDIAANLGLNTSIEERAAAMTKQQPGRTKEELVDEIILQYPDLKKQLLEGVNGIHLVGGALHAGMAAGGITLSIYTARLAVESIAGKNVKDKIGPHLAHTLFLFRGEPEPVLYRDVLEMIRPLPIASWTRNWLPHDFVEDKNGVSKKKLPDEDYEKYLLGQIQLNDSMRKVLALTNGRHTIRDIIQKTNCDSEEKVNRLLGFLRTMWKNNLLTWLPPQ